MAIRYDITLINLHVLWISFPSEAHGSYGKRFLILIDSCAKRDEPGILSYGIFFFLESNEEVPQ